MTQPEFSYVTPQEDPAHQPPGSARARRRHARRMVIPQDAQGQSVLLAALTRRAYPSYELFIYALLAGAILGLGYLLDSQAVLLLGILIAPLMTPWVGILIGLIIGSLRFVFETFMALLISAMLIFLCGALTGFAARIFLPRTFDSAFFHSRLWIPELVALVLGAVILVISFVRSESKPYLPSVVIAYGLFLPISSAGFGLGSGVPGLWPQAAWVTLAHFALISLVGLLTLFALKFRPALSGLLFSGGAILLLLVILVFLMRPGTGFALVSPQDAAAGLATATLQLVAAPLIESTAGGQPTSLNGTAIAPTVETPTPFSPLLDVTLPPTETPTITMTIEPTPVLARVRVSRGGGAILYEKPAGNGYTVLDNFSIVEVLPDTMDVNQTIWAHVIANQNGNLREGWIVQLYLEFATPVPDWQPSPTAVFTPST